MNLRASATDNRDDYAAAAAECSAVTRRGVLSAVCTAALWTATSREAEAVEAAVEVLAPALVRGSPRRCSFCGYVGSNMEPAGSAKMHPPPAFPRRLRARIL